MKSLLHWLILVPLVIVLILILMGGTAHANDQPQLTVEVLKAETVHWTTYWHTSGSSGTTKTDCDIGSYSASCTSKTEGARPASDTPIDHTQVNLLVKMPDGTTISMQCHYPPWWATCIEPQLGTYKAKINGHNIHLLIPVVTGKPTYNKDGTIKKPARVGVEEVKFSFQ